MSMSTGNASREPWNKGKIVGQKAPFKRKRPAIPPWLGIGVGCR